MQDEIKRYDEMWNKVQAGQISEETWTSYCMACLSEILNDHRDVMVRLKNR